MIGKLLLRKPNHISANLRCALSPCVVNQVHLLGLNQFAFLLAPARRDSLHPCALSVSD